MEHDFLQARYPLLCHPTNSGVYNYN